MKKLIVFLICKRLKLKTYEAFRFTNQRSQTDYYYFTETGVMKCASPIFAPEPSRVSLNWLLHDDCEVEKIELG